MKNHASKTNKNFGFTNRLLTGLIIALAATLTAFEWTTVTTEAIVYTSDPGEGVEMDPPLRFTIKKLEKPEPKKKPSDQIKVVVDIPELTDEIIPDEPEKENTDTQPTTNIGDEYGDETIVEIDFNKIYHSVQIFAHYDECSSLDGDELMECSKLAIINQVREQFVVSEWLKDVGGRQAAQVSFIIDKKGNVGNIEVLRATSKAMEKDAKKALKKLPPMNPAVQQGRNVKLQMVIPIIVKLQ